MLGALIPLLAPTAHAAPPVTLLTEGDVLSTGFGVTSIDNLAVNDRGTWLVEVDTDGPDTDADGAIVGAPGVLYTEGQALAGPYGATLDSFDDLSLDNRDTLAWNLFLDGTAGTQDDSGIYVGDKLLVQESELATYPEASPYTPWIGFFGVKHNDRGELLVLGSIDDPAINSSVDRALVVLRPDGFGGLQQFKVATEGDLLPGQTEGLADIDTDPHEWDLNGNGVAAWIADLEGDTAVDAAIYVGGALVAQEGDPSPVPGRSYELLADRALSLNDRGLLLHRANLDGDTTDDEVIVLDGRVVAQEGSTLDGIAPGFAITSFGTGPVALGNNGNWVVFADWDDPDTTGDTGLFVNGSLLLQEGMPLPDGRVVEDVRGITDGFALSDSGRWLVAEVNLVGSEDRALLFDLADQLRIVSFTPGLAGTSSVITVRHAVPGHELAFVAGTVPGSKPVPGCGGTAAVDVANPKLLGRRLANDAGTAQLTVSVPSHLGGRTGQLQVVDLDACAVSPQLAVSL